MGRETEHEAYHGVQATMMQVREVRKYGRGTRTVTDALGFLVCQLLWLLTICKESADDTCPLFFSL